MKSSSILLILLLMGISVPSNGQRIYVQEWQAWFRYYNQTRWNEKSTLHLELDERKRLNPWSQFQVFTNAHLHYRAKPWLDIGGGTSYVLTNPSDALVITEFRPWVEGSLFKKSGKEAIFQFRYRMEERLINRDDKELLLVTRQYIWRNRFRVQFSQPVAEFNKNKTLTLKLADEIMIHAGSVDRLFDQNQFTAALEFKFTDYLSLENSYVNIFQPISEYLIRDRHVIRTTLYHRIDLRKRS